MNEKDVTIKIVNLDRLSYVEKCFRCEVCRHGTMDRDMKNCPLIKRIATDITQTTYSIDGSKLNIITSTYDHDFRRALSVVHSAIESQCCRKR